MIDPSTHANSKTNTLFISAKCYNAKMLAMVKELITEFLK